MIESKKETIWKYIIFFPHKSTNVLVKKD